MFIIANFMGGVNVNLKFPWKCPPGLPAGAPFLFKEKGAGHQARPFAEMGIYSSRMPSIIQPNWGADSPPAATSDSGKCSPSPMLHSD